MRGAERRTPGIRQGSGYLAMGPRLHRRRNLASMRLHVHCTHHCNCVRMLGVLRHIHRQGRKPKEGAPKQNVERVASLPPLIISAPRSVEKFVNLAYKAHHLGQASEAAIMPIASLSDFNRDDAGGSSKCQSVPCRSGTKEKWRHFCMLTLSAIIVFLIIIFLWRFLVSMAAAPALARSQRYYLCSPPVVTQRSGPVTPLVYPGP